MVEGLAVLTLAGLSKIVNKIGSIIGMRNSFIVFNDTICEGTAPSMHEAIVGIKRSPETILGSMESMIEVPLDVYEHLIFSPMFDYSQAWMTSRYDLIVGLKNTESKLELYHFNKYGGEDLPCGGRKIRCSGDFFC